MKKLKVGDIIGNVKSDSFDVWRETHTYVPNNIAPEISELLLKCRVDFYGKVIDDDTTMFRTEKRDADTIEMLLSEAMSRLPIIVVPKVFISHASKDDKVADAICEVLEHKGIKCWIDHRDIHIGAEFDVEIMKGIKDCTILLILISPNSNNNQNVKKEVIIASGKEKRLVPFFLEEINLSDRLGYHLTDLHWLMADNDKGYANLIQVVEKLLSVGVK
jgi:hypothetical protein